MSEVELERETGAWAISAPRWLDLKGRVAQGFSNFYHNVLLVSSSLSIFDFFHDRLMRHIGTSNCSETLTSLHKSP